MPHDTTVETTDEKETDEAIVQAARDCLKDYQEREDDNIQRAEAAIRFRALQQWPDAIRREREDNHQDGGPRPCPVLDKTNQYVRQVVNEERLSRAAIKIRPVDDDADEKVAEVFTGIIRHIEDASRALSSYTKAGEQAVDGGFGYFRILTEYSDDMSFEQDIRIKRIDNRFSVALGLHREPDGSDAMEGLIWEDIALTSFKTEYPKAETVGFEQADDWGNNKDTIRIAEFMRIEPETINIHQLDDGSVVTDEELETLRADFGEIKPLDTRETIKNTVKWYKVSGHEVLETEDMLGSFIPIVKVIGEEITMPDGKIRLSGMIEAMMDAQRLHNYAHAGFIESVALAPRAPWVAEEGQVEDYEDEYAAANNANIAVLKYKGVSTEDGRPLPPPQRTPPPGMSTGWQQILVNTREGIEGAAGMYGPSIGSRSQEKSGIALREQKEQGAIGNFHFPDNLARSISYAGRILLEWIPKIYDKDRVARMLGEDGVADVAYLNQDQDQAVADRLDGNQQPIGKSYNLNVGRYDVTVTTGPSYTAKRQEAAELQMEIVNAKPEFMPLIGDILFDNLDAPGSDEISKRLKTMLPPEIKQLEQEEEGGPSPEVQAMMQQMDVAMQQIEQKAAELNQAEQEMAAQAQDIGADKIAVETSKKELAADRKVFDANIKEQKANLQLVGKQLVDKIEDATDPIVQQLANQTKDVDDDDEPSPQLEHAVEVIAELNVQSTQMMVEAINNSLVKMTEMMNAPRETTLINDDKGNPTGSVSRPA